MNFDIPDIGELCANYGYECRVGQLEDFGVERDRIILVAGAGILPETFVKSHTIINAHPGYIPNCRGLDALKWAIVENQPIGVTTHLRGDYVDAGQVIERRLIPVYMVDTFHALAQRVYENEVSMLVGVISKFDVGSLEMLYPGNNEVHKRMPENMEESLLQKFEEYKNKHGVERMEII